MKTKPGIFVVFILLLSFFMMSCGVGQLFEPSPTPMPTSTPRPTQTPKPANTATPQPTATLEEIPLGNGTAYIIPAGTFDLDTQDSCSTDVNLMDYDGKSFGTSGTISMRGGNFVLWCPGAKHTWIGSLTYEGYTFASDENDPLTFTLDIQGAYQYVSGTGQVIHGSETITLPQKGLAFSRILLAEGFNDESAWWPVGDVQGSYWNGTRLIENGVLDWNGTSVRDMFSNVTPDRDDLLEPQTNFQVSAKVRFPDPVMEGYVGLTIRGKDTGDQTSFYAFVLESSGYYTFWLYENDEWITLIDWTEIPYVDFEAWNTMAVQAVGNHFRLYLNGNLLGEVNDGTLESGNNGLILGVYESDKPIRAQFDDFIVRIADDVPEEYLEALPETKEEDETLAEATDVQTRAWSLPYYPDAVYITSDLEGDAEWDDIVEMHARNLAIEPPYYYEFYQLSNVRRYDEVRTFYQKELQALGYKQGADLQGNSNIYLLTFVNAASTPQKKITIQYWTADSLVLIIYKNP